MKKPRASSKHKEVLAQSGASCEQGLSELSLCRKLTPSEIASLRKEAKEAIQHARAYFKKHLTK